MGAAPAVPRAGATFWLEQALARETDAVACPPLAGNVQADVCIVGGGYTGLYTALELKESSPELDVVLIEAQACGLGASGRNGGWATSWYDEVDRLVEHFGHDQGVWLADASSAAIDRIEAIVSSEGIECDFRRRGSLWVSTAPGQDAIVDGPLATAEAVGRIHHFERCSRADIERITASPVGRSGILIKDGAAVQPALLVRGLRAAALRRGVRIFEATPMLELQRERRPVVLTPAGRVTADQVVMATNVAAARLRELRRSVFVVGAQMVLTEPIPDRLPDTLWREGLLFGDARMFVHYAQVTGEGRIAFGRGGGAVGPFNKVVPRHYADDAVIATVARDFREWFPDLADVRITHAWGGPVDRAPGHLPFVGALGDHENVHYVLGYSGNGVGPSALMGRILARRALQVDDEYTRCALVGGPPALLPPEPLLSSGAAIIKRAVQRTEENEERGMAPGPAGRLAKRAASFSIPVRRRA